MPRFYADGAAVLEGWLVNGARHQSTIILFRIKLISKGVHCIGDKTSHNMLDIYENIIKEGSNVSEWRPRTCSDFYFS
jgi:hypothetical protein